MSYTTVLKFDLKNKDMGEIKDLPNGWLSAPLVWDYLTKKYIGGHWMTSFNELFKLTENEKLPDYERIMLLITCDRALLHKENYSRAVSDIELFIKNSGITNSHWPEIINILKDSKDDAIGFQMTSVSDNPFHGDFNEDTEEYEIDWDKTFDVYEEFDGMKKEVSNG